MVSHDMFDLLYVLSHVTGGKHLLLCDISGSQTDHLLH